MYFIYKISILTFYTDLFLKQYNLCSNGTSLQINLQKGLSQRNHIFACHRGWDAGSHYRYTKLASVFYDPTKSC